MSEPDNPGVEEGAVPFDAEVEAPLPLTDEGEAALLEAEADVAAGRVVPHEEVAKWLATWGTPDEKPMPKSWRR